MDALKVIAQDSLKTGDEIPQIKIGDTVKVSVKIREGERERIQAFEGTVIARKVGRFRDLHRSQSFLRCRRRESLPGTFTQRC